MQTSCPGGCETPSFNLRMDSTGEKEVTENLLFYVQDMLLGKEKSVESLAELSKFVAVSALWWLEETLIQGRGQCSRFLLSLRHL